MLYFVEYLTLRTWLFAVLPRLLKRRQARGSAVTCFYIDASRLALFAAQAAARLIGGFEVSRLKFRQLDVRDEDGLLIRLRIPYRDLEYVQAHAVAEPAFYDFAAKAPDGRLLDFVRKNLSMATLSDRQTIWRALMIVQICIWGARQRHSTDQPVVFMESRPWFSTVQWYAQQNAALVVPVRRSVTLRDLVLRRIPPTVEWLLRALRNKVMHLRFLKSKRVRKPSSRVTLEPRIATEYTGYFNLSRPECYSDFFFWQQSSLPGKAMLMTFSIPRDPIDEQRAAALEEQGIRPVAVSSQATSSAFVDLFNHWPRLKREFPLKLRKTAERKWLLRQVRDYELRRDYWTAFFRKENVKVYVSWYRYDGAHCAIADAVQSLGGISVIYQRACQPDAGPEVAVHCDVAFGYAPFDAEVERRSGSTIEYHVAVGYFGDHRFEQLKRPAAELRQKLQQSGARFIIAFFDENSHPDERWQTGHGLQQENYASVLERVLSDPSLGLVLKPKVPSSLRKRLGPVANLLQRALATGRCHIYEEGIIAGSYPPAVAALAADVAIHGHMAAATAGLEAALAGVRTVMMDREGWHISDMYELGRGRVVFREWNELWPVFDEYRESRGHLPGFGDWSSMLDKLDPFRDGRGAQRMGTYLNWLLEGLKAGRHREEVMAEAASRYCERWGYDKIAPINVDSSRSRPIETSSPTV